MGQRVMGLEFTATEIDSMREDLEEYRESYDSLLLSPGAEPIRPPIPGIDLDGLWADRDSSSRSPRPGD